MKLKKMYGIKEDIMYYIYLPKYLLMGLWLILTRNPIDAEVPFSWRDKIKLAQSFCNVKVGRFYVLTKEKEEEILV